MNKRMIRLPVLTTMIAAFGTCAAQSTKQTITGDQRVAEAKALMQAGRYEIVAEEMVLTAAERERFWPLYRRYRADVMAVKNRYASMIGG